MFSVSDHIIKSTTNCENAFSCLSGKKDCLCEVESDYGTIIFLNAPNPNMFCSYRMSFGYSHVCHCPTRKEIYKQYRR